MITSIINDNYYVVPFTCFKCYLTNNITGLIPAIKT